ncbi:Phage-like element PBSX protein, XkdF [uncultured Caudovirales phage]|uniref:Phage-like element PBSX protein, XkdF n=1 Tax=uncultured Caudovirales phage TaxID=2100421 RepID=A0A6J5NSH3_9CAUD|nr:Phage-like element PBSX protein, XkdF [uncultured Caudovirales phage]
MKVYELIIDGDDEELGMTFISIVDTPAIEVKGYAFSEQKEYKFTYDKDKQIIAGPALIPDLKIKRIDDYGKEYYVYFSKETIDKMVRKFMKGGISNKINFNHQNKIVDAYIFSSWIVEDKSLDKSKMYGYDLPAGSYFIEVKVDDKDFWDNYVKKGYNSFSIEGYFNEKIMKFAANPSLNIPVPKSVKDRIAFAIQNQSYLTFFYNNRWTTYEAYRNIRPLALGKLKSSGRWALRGYIENNNSYALLNGFTSDRFRIFLLSRMLGDVTLGQDVFNIPAGYRKNDKDLTSIIAQLSSIQEDYDDDIEDDIFEAVEYTLSEEDILDIFIEDELKEAFVETYNDYPQAASDNAKRALKYMEENPDKKCGTLVGKARANQLANREPISRETIARMSSFARHRQNKDVPYNEGCGGIVWDFWGGTEGIEYAQRKLKEIDNKKQEFKIEPTESETQEEFLQRCIPFEINSGMEPDQAAAVCYTKWDDSK